MFKKKMTLKEVIENPDISLNLINVLMAEIDRATWEEYVAFEEEEYDIEICLNCGAMLRWQITDQTCPNCKDDMELQVKDISDHIRLELSEFEASLL